MDNSCKKILKLFDNNPDRYVMYDDDLYQQVGLLSEDEFYRAVRYLESEGLIEYITNQNGAHLGFVLSHKYVHRKRIRFDSFVDWFFHSYIGGVLTGVTTTVLAELILFLLLS